MKIEMFALGQLQTNCYLLLDENKTCVIVDPAAEADFLIDYLKKNELKLSAILLTHSHYDHTGALRELKAETGAQVYIHSEEVENEKSKLFSSLKSKEGLTYIKDGEELSFGGIRLKALWTPGHTPGSVCFIAENAIFAGDTLFMGSCGRVDFSGGSFADMMASLKKLSELKGDFDVYPGHGPETSLARERSANPYMRRAMLM